MKERPKAKSAPYWDEALTQYILDSVASVDSVIIKRFTPEDKQILSRIQYASLEQKLHILGKVGKRFAIVVADRGSASRQSLNIKSMALWFRERILKLAGPTLRSWGLFVRADKEIIQHLSRLSLDINPKTMHLLRNYEEIVKFTENIKDIRSKSHLEAHSHVLIDRLITESMGFQLRYDNWDRDRYKMSKEHVPLLFFLSTNRDRYITALELSIFLGIRKELATNYCSILADTGHLQEDLVEGLIKEGEVTRVYQLTGYGATIVNQIRERITIHT